MNMHSPPHPGEILKEDVLSELGRTVGEFAAHLGISRPHLSKILNGHAGNNAEMDHGPIFSITASKAACPLASRRRRQSWATITGMTM